MAVTITGARGTGNISADIRRIEIGTRIGLLQPSAAPLTWLTSRITKRVSADPKFNWVEDDLNPRFSATSTTVTNVATTVPVTTGQGTYFAQHDLVKVPRTGEVFRVTAVATDNLTAVRGVGSTATAMNSAEEIMVIGSAQPEGDTSKPARSGNPTKLTNYTQIFRRSVDMTNTERATKQVFTEHDWDYNLRKEGIEFALDLEDSFLFGRPSEDLTGSQPRRSTAGLLHFISTNQTDAGGTFTEAEFQAASRQWFRYANASQTKFALASPLAVSVLNGYALGRLQVVQASSNNEYGLNITSYTTPAGTIKLVMHPRLQGATYGGYLVVTDTENMEYRYLEGRDVHVNQDIGANDYDGRKDEYLAEVGLQFGLEKRSGLVTNITG